MDPATANIISAGITAGASLLGGAGSGFSHAANKMNRRNQDRSFKYTRALRQSEYQDKMDSLAAAGLNPILAGQYGSTGASVGNAGTFDPNIGKAARMQAVAGAANSAMQAAKTPQEIDKLEAETKHILNQARLVGVTAQQAHQMFFTYFDKMKQAELTEINMRIDLLVEQVKSLEKTGEFDQVNLNALREAARLFADDPKLGPFMEMIFIGVLE